MNFPINTQEELDVVIKERLDRERAKFADYDALKAKAAQYDQINAQDYPGQLTALQQRFDNTAADLADLTKRTNEAAATNQATIEDLQAKLAASELSGVRTRVCIESGLPFHLAGRLKGSTEEEIKADAAELAKFVVPAGVPGARRETAPSDNPAPARTGTGGNPDVEREEALRGLARAFFGQASERS